MSPTIGLIRAIAENEEGEYQITWKEFQRVEELLENRRVK
jgi:hypothetical protein